MSAPVDLEHVPAPPWLGESLTGAGSPGATGSAGGLAVGGDVGGLEAYNLDMGVAGDLTFNVVSGAGAAAGQYQQSLIEGQTRWEEALKVFESAVYAGLDVGFGQLNPVFPVADALVVKPVLSRGFGIDLSVAETIGGTVRAGGALAVAVTTGRRQNLARLEARAQTGGMGSLGRRIAQLVAWLRGDETESEEP